MAATIIYSTGRVSGRPPVLHSHSPIDEGRRGGRGGARARGRDRRKRRRRREAGGRRGGAVRGVQAAAAAVRGRLRLRALLPARGAAQVRQRAQGLRRQQCQQAAPGMVCTYIQATAAPATHAHTMLHASTQPPLASWLLCALPSPLSYSAHIVYSRFVSPAMNAPPLSPRWSLACVAMQTRTRSDPIQSNHEQSGAAARTIPTQRPEICCVFITMCPGPSASTDIYPIWYKFIRTDRQGLVRPCS